MALNGLKCADVPLSNYSLTHSLSTCAVPSDDEHLCHPLVDKTGWTTKEPLSTCAVPSDDEQHDESECEHGPAEG